MNPVLLLTHNGLELTKRCAESVRKQDIPSESLIYDNGSSDGTIEWLPGNSRYSALRRNAGVSAAWNLGIGYLLAVSPHVLVVGNDTVLPPSFYRTLLSVDLPFVTGVAVDNMEQALQPPAVMPLTPNPDFSAFLIRREAWEAIGPFDESMKFYSSDQDYHIRGWRRGVHMVKASVPFYHERSSTIRLASPEERAEIEAQANKDRATLRMKWGVSAGGPDYEALFVPSTFGCEQTHSSHSAQSPAEHDSNA
jgi:GT2 family glycosyltransferase